MEFGKWLRKQANRNDVVGDLAQDFRASGSKALTEAGVRRSMTRHGCTDDIVWAALEIALDEWGQR